MQKLIPPLPPWIEKTGKGLVLHLKIQAGASRSEIVGFLGEQERLKVRIAAPPVEGRANEEVIRFFSKLLDSPKSGFSILRGQTSPIKDLLCVGVKLEKILEQTSKFIK